MFRDSKRTPAHLSNANDTRNSKLAQKIVACSACVAVSAVMISLTVSTMHGLASSAQEYLATTKATASQGTDIEPAIADRDTMITNVEADKDASKQSDAKPEVNVSDNVTVNVSSTGNGVSSDESTDTVADNTQSEAVQPETTQDTSHVQDIEKWKYWTVKPTDTLSYISAKTGVSVDEIANLNEIRNVHMIYDDSVLRLPEWATVE